LFNLTRYFSLISATGIFAVILILSFFFGYLSEKNMLKIQTQANVNITHSFANSAWVKVANFIQRSAKITTKEALIKQPETAFLQRFTKSQMEGTNVVKIKIYNLKGLTVFSTEQNQIGQDKSASQGFIQASSGLIVSEISFRDQFNALENSILDRNLITTYIPIKSQDSEKVVAVFEVYSDVTDLVSDINKGQITIALSVSLILLLLYLFLYLIIRHAHNLILNYDKERADREKEVFFQAYHDNLTGLLNRASFTEKIQEVRARLNRHNKLAAILFIDLDRFKSINDNLGHDAGNQVLKEVASKIQNSIRETDYAFRISGDEFLVILEDLESKENAFELAERIQKSAKKPIHISNHEITLSMSIGATIFSSKESPVESDDLVNQADLAMYQAKKNRTRNIEFFSTDMKVNSINKFTLETELSRAIINDEFIPFFQAKVQANSFELSSIETLLRWKHPEKGIIPPDEFIPLLEETGLICEVGNNLIQQVCHIASKWENENRPIRISVNISALQFRSESFIDVIKGALDASQLSPHLLELELTETLFLEGTEFTIGVLNKLKALGVIISIDDFGKGYSSLNYLKRLQIDILKIDKSFITDIIKDERDLAITKSVISLSHSLNMKTIAEGIETEEQAILVRNLGCDELQGFFFSKPLPLKEFELDVKSRGLISHLQ